MSFSQTSRRQGWNKNAYLIETTAEIDSHPCWAKVNSHLRFFFAANVFHRCWCVCSLSEPANVKWFRTSLGTRYGSTFYKWQESEEEISLKPGKDSVFHSTLVGLTRTSQLQPAVHTRQLRWRCRIYTFLPGETPVDVRVQQPGWLFHPIVWNISFLRFSQIRQTFTRLLRRLRSSWRNITAQGYLCLQEDFIGQF